MLSLSFPVLFPVFNTLQIFNIFSSYIFWPWEFYTTSLLGRKENMSLILLQNDSEFPFKHDFCDKWEMVGRRQIEPCAYLMIHCWPTA